VLNFLEVMLNSVLSVYHETYYFVLTVYYILYMYTCRYIKSDHVSYTCQQHPDLYLIRLRFNVTYSTKYYYKTWLSILLQIFYCRPNHF
jgi:hypothetical protein